MHPSSGTSMNNDMTLLWSFSMQLCGNGGSVRKNDSIVYPFHVRLSNYFECDENTIKNIILELTSVTKTLNQKPVKDVCLFSLPENNSNIFPRYSKSVYVGTGSTDLRNMITGFKNITNEKFSCVRWNEPEQLRMNLYKNTDQTTAQILDNFIEINLNSRVYKNTWDKINIVLWKVDNSTWKVVHSFELYKKPK